MKRLAFLSVLVLLFGCSNQELADTKVKLAEANKQLAEQRNMLFTLRNENEYLQKKLAISEQHAKLQETINDLRRLNDKIPDNFEAEKRKFVDEARKLIPQ